VVGPVTPRFQLSKASPRTRQRNARRFDQRRREQVRDEMRKALTPRPIPEARVMTGGWTPTLPELRLESEARARAMAHLRAYDHAREQTRTAAPLPDADPPGDTSSDDLTICTVS